MTKKLESILGLPPMEVPEEIEAPAPVTKTRNELIEEATEIEADMNNSDKIDTALATVTDLHEHDLDMDEISKRAIRSYEDLIDLGLNVPDVHAGKVYEVAANMLKTAMDARNSKVDRKLKMIDLQLKKLKIDKDAGKKDEKESKSSVEFDRNDLIQQLLDQRNANNGKDNDK